MSLGKYWAIQQKAHFMSAKYASQTYVIGFPNIDIARRVARNCPIDNNDVIRLTRTMHEDVALDVKRSMMEMSLPIAEVSDRITIDIMAQLHIPKHDNTSDEHNGIQCFDSHEFLMFPFEQRTGVIMPYELVDETVREYTFLCNVIDPSFNIDMFRKSLDRKII